MSYVSTSIKQAICIDRIITIHYFEYMKNFYFQGESHNFWEFVCVDKGEVKIQADENLYLLKKGDCIFHKPLEFHSIQSSGISALNLVVLSFESDSPSMRYFEGKTFHLSDENKSLLSRVINEAKLAFSNPIHIPSVEQVVRSQDAPFGSEQLVKLNLELLLINLVREENPAKIHSKPLYIDNHSAETPLEKILCYLELHICERLSIKMICNDNLIGRSCLQGLFHKELNCGVIEYFNRIKIDLAKQIIRDNTKNFSEISDFLSYNSLPYFSRQFKNITGMSPSEYSSSIKGISEKLAVIPPQHKQSPPIRLD